MMKKLVSMLLILSLVFSGAMSFGAEVPPEWALPALENLASYDIVAEAFYDHFDQKVTRAEFAYLGVRLYETLTGTLAETGSDRFIDTKDEWVLKAKHHGIVNGYSDGSFKPDQAIRRDELAALFVNTLRASKVDFAEYVGEKFADDDRIAGWAKDAVYIAKANGIISGIGDNLFGGASPATILQSLLMFNNVMSNDQISGNVDVKVEVTESKPAAAENDKYTHAIELSSYVGMSPKAVYDALKPLYDDHIITTSYEGGATYISIGKPVNDSVSQEIAFFSKTGEVIDHIWIGFNTSNNLPLDLSKRLETINGVGFTGSSSDVLARLGLSLSDLTESRQVTSFNVIGYSEDLGDGRSWRVEFLEDMSMLFGMGIYY